MGTFKISFLTNVRMTSAVSDALRDATSNQREVA